MIAELLGETIASNSQVLEVECHDLYAGPAFGSFVRADCVGSGLGHFAVVTHVSTGPFDGNRVVQAHRMPPGELEQRKPHLTTVIRTVSQARLIGYGQGTARVIGTAPRPPRLHCYVDPGRLGRSPEPDGVAQLPAAALPDARRAARGLAGMRPAGGV